MRSTAEERWLEAERRISPQLSAERRRASRRAWLLLAIAVLVYAALTVVIRALLPHHSNSPSSDDGALPPTFWIGSAMAGAGLLVDLATVTVGFSTRRLRPPWERVDGALSRTQNRAVRRQIRAREPVDPRHRAVVRAVAEQDIRTASALIPGFIGIALIAVGLMLMIDRPELTALLAGLLALLTAAAAWQYWSTVPAARRHLASP